MFVYITNINRSGSTKNTVLLDFSASFAIFQIYRIEPLDKAQDIVYNNSRNR